jgi:hypothetical protein
MLPDEAVQQSCFDRSVARALLASLARRVIRGLAALTPARAGKSREAIAGGERYRRRPTHKANAGLTVEPLVPQFHPRPQAGGTAPPDDRAVLTAIVRVLTGNLTEPTTRIKIPPQTRSD